jgi:hypothetical protein
MQITFEINIYEDKSNSVFPLLVPVYNRYIRWQKMLSEIFPLFRKNVVTFPYKFSPYIKDLKKSLLSP